MPPRKERISVVLDISEVRERKMLLTGDRDKDRRLWRDIEWCSEHSQELHEKYERLWIAIYDQRVIAAGKDPRIVEREAIGQTGVTSPKEIHMRYVEDTQTLYGQIAF